MCFSLSLRSRLGPEVRMSITLQPYADVLNLQKFSQLQRLHLWHSHTPMVFGRYATMTSADLLSLSALSSLQDLVSLS